MIYSHASSITASVKASDKDNKMRSNFRHPHTPTHVRAPLARFMFPSSILFASQSASCFWSALQPPERRKNRGRKKKKPLLWLIKHEHPAVHSLPFLCRPPHSPPFRFPSNPISNSPFWQLKMGWWKLCKCALFVMLFFLHTSTSCLFNTSKAVALSWPRFKKKGGSLDARRTYRMIYDLVT